MRQPDCTLGFLQWMVASERPCSACVCVPLLGSITPDHLTCCTVPDELDACLGEMEDDRALAQSIALCNGCASTRKGLPRQGHVQAIGAPCRGNITKMRVSRAVSHL